MPFKADGSFCKLSNIFSTDSLQLKLMFVEVYMGRLSYWTTEVWQLYNRKMPSKFFTSSKGHQYAFDHLDPQSSGSKLLFLHGFPSHTAEWIR